LSNGRVIAQGPPAQIQGDDRVIEVYMGRRSRGPNTEGKTI
jgi:ABC-type branched-subunit amino acid transport system ATPase component